jgi:hypothetical protein
MSSKNHINIINGLLEQVSNTRHHSSSSERMSYELGYLMGLLANLMDNDSYVYRAVKSRIDKPKIK